MSFFRKPWRGKGRPSRPPRYRPRVQTLEDRTVLSFFTPPSFAVGTRPIAEAVGDFNGDGLADLVVVNQGSNTVSVLLGNGDGTFQPRTDYATGTAPIAAAVGDFNGDGKPDLAVANFGSKTLSVLLGNGDGSFAPRTDLALTTTPVSLAVADLNGDGKLDLAVATEDLANDYLTVLRGDGDGTFQVPASTVTDSAGKGASLSLEPFSTISVGDVNGDGRLDLVVVNNKDAFNTRGGQFFFGGTVSVVLGNGDGTFQAPHNFAVGTSPRTVTVGDFNGDGRLDFAVGNYMSGTVSAFLNTGGGNFTSSNLAPGGAPFALAAGDFNGDGRADLAVATAAPFGDDVALFSGQAGGGLQAAATYVGPAFGPLNAADLNADGHLDLVGIIPTVSAVSTLLNNGAGTFPAPVLVNNPGVALAAQATADFNGDGIPDLALAGGQVELGLGDGNFGDVTNLFGGSGVAAADVDGNGTPDLLFGSQAFPSGKVALLLNSPGWDNRTGGAVGFTVAVAPQVTAGANVSVTVTAVDASGNAVPDFLGTVDLDDSAPGSTSLKLVGQYTFTAADAGRHTFIVSRLTQAGANTLSTFAVAMPTVAVAVTVVPAPPAKFVLATPASVPAGTPFSFTITAEDSFGNVETGYTGTVHFSAGAADPQAVLPADYTFGAADAGSHTFSATLFRTLSALSPTAPSLTATDAAHVSNTAPVNVLSLAPVSLTMLGVPNQTTAGALIGVTVAALDVYGNAAAAYTGTVHFTSSDAQAGLPADYTFTAGDRGAHVFYPSLKTVGTQSLGVTDTGNPAFAGNASGVVVVPAMPTVWVVTGVPAATTAGTPQTFTLTATDSFGNVATNYFGRVHFSSSDGQAGLPLDYTFTAADAGSHAFTATLKTAGAQSLTFTDTVSTVLTGTQSITVAPAAAVSFVVTGFPATTAGVTQGFTVTVKDGFGNVATNYTGTVTFGSSDPLAALPGNYTFTAADAGSHTFTATLKKAGTQSITVTDATVATVLGSQTGILVTAAAVAQFGIVAPANVTQGVGFTITVSALDAFGNVVTGYRGKVHFSTTASNAGLPSDFTFRNNDNGVHVFSVTLNTLGLQTLRVTDTTNNAVFGSVLADVSAKSGGSGGP